MATTIKTFNSEGGFGVNQTTLVTDTLDLKNINTFELKNSNYSDASRKDYILKGLNTSILTTDGISLMTLPSNTVNFVTSQILGVNPDGSGLYSLKFDSTVKCDSSGDVSLLSEIKSIIKETIPTGQTWTVSSYDSGSNNSFSYSVTRGGTTDVIKWIACVSIVSVDWL
jgi:hypothetical protein